MLAGIHFCGDRLGGHVDLLVVVCSLSTRDEVLVFVYVDMKSCVPLVFG